MMNVPKLRPETLRYTLLLNGELVRSSAIMRTNFAGECHRSLLPKVWPAIPNVRDLIHGHRPVRQRFSRELPAALMFVETAIGIVA
jgi:hypothetical protein